MWIDTHNHFHFDVFKATRAANWSRAQYKGVMAQFAMSVTPDDFVSVASLASDTSLEKKAPFDGTYFALGIHPLFVDSLDLTSAIEQLRHAVIEHLVHPKFIGIGEIGLDGFVKNSDFSRQIDFFRAQLKIAREFDLPVFMHVRKSQDIVLKYCREIGVGHGIAHAFNGSHQQADRFLTQGFKLGFGGAFTYPRAKQLRRLAIDLPIESFVLETDAPDMSPEWACGETNFSYHLPQIAECFAKLRGISIHTLAKTLVDNTESAVNPKRRLLD